MIDIEEQQRAAENLDQVGNEHDAALWQRIGKGADEGGKQDVKQNEGEFQKRRQRCRRLHGDEHVDRDEQQGVVRQRR
jgi:hypothetical protein